MLHGTVVKDSQNPYRTGVLVGNHVEDRYGQDLIQQDKNWRTPASEQQAKFNMGSSMFAYDFPPKTTEDLLADKEQKEYEKIVSNLKYGVPNHLFLGHGPTQEHFERRDFGTTNQMFYDKKMNAQTLISSHFYNSDNKHLDKLHTNAKIEDAAPIFGKSGTALGETQARAYNEFTKRFDNNYNKIGLRK